MSDLQLEVGKTYVTKYLSTDGGVKSTDLIKIIGKVEEDTREYSFGCRFYNDRGLFYTANGSKPHHRSHSAESWNKQPTWNDRRDKRQSSFDLEREATSNDFAEGLLEIIRYSSQQLSNASKFIPVTDPSFVMTLGGIYVNRMGLPHFITVLSHSNRNDRIWFRAAGGGSYLETGRCSVTKSMKDLVFQKI